MHTFNVPRKSRAMEGWLIVLLVAAMLALLALAV
jgi:hypothetical protein